MARLQQSFALLAKARSLSLEVINAIMPERYSSNLARIAGLDAACVLWAGGCGRGEDGFGVVAGAEAGTIVVVAVVVDDVVVVVLAAACEPSVTCRRCCKVDASCSVVIAGLWPEGAVLRVDGLVGREGLLLLLDPAGLLIAGNFTVYSVLDNDVILSSKIGICVAYFKFCMDTLS